MACFIAPLTEGVIISVAKKIYNKKSNTDSVVKEAFSKKLSLLKNMLFGVGFLSMLEHVYHGEIIPVFPFLTAVRDGQTAEMFKEIMTEGAGMAVAVTGAWALACAVYDRLQRSKKTVAVSEKTMNDGCTNGVGKNL